MIHDGFWKKKMKFLLQPINLTFTPDILLKEL